MRLGSSVFIALIVVSAVQAQSAPTARETIERAIVVHGGVEKLSRVRADQVKWRGQIFAGKTSTAFVNDTTIRHPGKYRSLVTLGEGERTHTIEHVLEGETATIRINGQTQPVAGVHLAQLRQTLQLDQAMKLVPLLGDGFVLESLGDYTINQRPCTGVGVMGRLQRGVKLFFDKETGFLVKSEHQVDGPGGKDVKQEAYYGDYREMGGYRRPRRMIAVRDGQKILDAELVEARPLPPEPSSEAPVR